MNLVSRLRGLLLVGFVVAWLIAGGFGRLFGEHAWRDRLLGAGISAGGVALGALAVFLLIDERRRVQRREDRFAELLARRARERGV